MPAALQHLQAIFASKHITVTPGVESGRPTFTICNPEYPDDGSVTMRFERRHRQWRPTDKFRVNYPDGTTEDLDGGIFAMLQALSKMPGSKGSSAVEGTSASRSRQTLTQQKKTVIRV